MDTATYWKTEPKQYSMQENDTRKTQVSSQGKLLQVMEPLKQDIRHKISNIEKSFRNSIWTGKQFILVPNSATVFQIHSPETCPTNSFRYRIRLYFWYFYFSDFIFSTFLHSTGRCSVVWKGASIHVPFYARFVLFS